MSEKPSPGASAPRARGASSPRTRRSFPGARPRLGAAGLGLLALAFVVNLHILGLAEWVTLDEGRVKLDAPWLAGGAPVALPVSARALAAATAAVAVVAVAAAGVWTVARKRWLTSRAGALLRHRRGAAGIAVGLAVLAFGFLPFGLLGSLVGTYAFYLAAVPGFAMTVYAAWPVAHRSVVRAAPGFERWIQGSSPRWLMAGLFGVTFLLTTGLSLLLFEHGPRIPTGIAHWFHARILVSGSLYGEAPPLPEFFSLLTVVTDSDRWFSIFPLGHTALVAGALLLGMPRIVNPLCGAVAVVLFYLLGKELFGERTGRLAAVFGLLSPFFVFMSSEFYNDSSSLVFCTAFLLFFARATKSGRLRDGLLAGVFLGLAVNTRPVTALAASLPFVGYSLWLLLRAPRRHALPLAGTCIATLAFVALLLASNYGITGDALATGYAHAGPVVEQRAFDPAKTIPSSVTRVLFLNRYLFQWAIPSLLPVALLFASGRATRWDYLLLSLLPSGLLAYGGWYHLGLELGPRYLYFATGALVILAVRGFQVLPAFARETVGTHRPVATATGAATIAVCCFLSAALLSWIPLATLYGSEKWWPLDRSVLERVRAAEPGPSIVFVPDAAFRAVFLENAVPVSAGHVIYARDLGERNPELMARFPDRTYYRFEGGELRPLRASPPRLPAP